MQKVDLGTGSSAGETMEMRGGVGVVGDKGLFRGWGETECAAWMELEQGGPGSSPGTIDQAGGMRPVWTRPQQSSGFFLTMSFLPQGG